MEESRLKVEEVVEVANAHAQAEERCELEPLMATMVAAPLFEFHPPAACLRGGEVIRRYYEQFLARFMPLVRSTTLIGEWASDLAAVHEYSIELEIDGERESHRIVAVLYASGTRLGGERLYSTERMIRLMLGEMFDELVPLEGA